MEQQNYNKMCCLLLIHIFLQEIKQAFTVQVLSVNVPPKVTVGSQISLGCLFDLQGKSLYSLNWWKNHQQFYQFSHTTSEHKLIHETHGIEVIVNESNLKTVSLRNVTKETSGEFKCEVVADFPSYERDSLSAPMQVVEVPTDAPIITVNRNRFRVGDLMKANCSSPGSIPPPSLTWQINGKEIASKEPFVSVKSKKLYIFQENSSTWDFIEGPNESVTSDITESLLGNASQPVTSEVTLVMKPIYFMHEGRATLTCTASIPELYRRSSSVLLSLPGIKQDEPSLRISTSQTNKANALLRLCILIILINLSLAC